MAIYRVLETDQKESEPIRSEELQQWISTGRIRAQDLVRAEGTTEWKALSEFPEFAESLARASGRSAASIPPLAPAPPPAPPMFPPPIARQTEGVGAPPASNPPASNSLAIVSLVLGILSMMGCFFVAGIPAIITGHIALNRARRLAPSEAGRGFALAGLILGYVNLLFLPIAAGLLLPALAQAKARAQRIMCVSQLKQIGLGARMYADSHKDSFPTSFVAMSTELSSPKLLVCPADGTKTVATDWATISDANISYEWIPTTLTAQSPDLASTVIVRCPVHGNVCLADGSVQQSSVRTRRKR